MKLSRPVRRARSAFTLTELLVVIFIIGLLAGLILAAVSMAGQSAKRAKAMKTVGELNNAVSLYLSHYGSSPLHPDSTSGLPGPLDQEDTSIYRYLTGEGDGQIWDAIRKEKHPAPLSYSSKFFYNDSGNRFLKDPWWTSDQEYRIYYFRKNGTLHSNASSVERDVYIWSMGECENYSSSIAPTSVDEESIVSNFQ